MKQVIGIAVLAAAAALAACSGGGGGGSTSVPPVATPTPAPKVSYSITVRQVAGGANGSASAAVRRVPLATVGSNVVLLTASDPLTIYTRIDTSSVVEAVVNPVPSGTPAPVWSSGVNGVQTAPLATPPSPQPGVYDQQVTTSSTSPTSGTLTISIPELNASANPQVYVYPRLSLACDPNSSTYSGGVAFVNGVVTPQSDPATSDIWISGPNCPGKFHSAEAENTLHYPGGGKIIPYPTALNTITAAAWSNVQTSNTLASMIANGATSFEYIIRTVTQAAPGTVKIALGSIQPGSAVGPGFLEGATCVLGSCVDGT
jgi:hypothetical protein